MKNFSRFLGFASRPFSPKTPLTATRHFSNQALKVQSSAIPVLDEEVMNIYAIDDVNPTEIVLPEVGLNAFSVSADASEKSDMEIMKKFFPDQFQRQIKSGHFHFESIKDDDQSKICEAVNFLDKKYKIKSLGFYDCVINDSGAEAIAQYIRKNKIDFAEIKFRKCSISSAGMMKIAEAFEDNFYVRNAFFEEVNLSDKEVILGTSESLEVLGLVIEALKKNFTLITGGLMISPKEYCYRETGALKTRNTRLLEDVIRDFTKVVIGPIFLMQIDKALEFAKSGKDAEFGLKVDKMFSVDSRYHEFKQDLEKAFLQKLFRNVSHQEKLDFIKNANSNRVKSAFTKFRKYEGHEWDPLFEGIMPLDGLELKVLSTSQELIDEGRKLRHCIGTYAKVCIENGDQIVSIINPRTQESLSTMQLVIDFDKEKISLKQHEGESRIEPSLMEQRIANKFVEAVNCGEIKIDFTALREARELRKKGLSRKQQETFDINFDPEDKGHYKKVLSSVSNLLKDTPRIRENFMDMTKENFRVFFKNPDFILPVELAPYGKEISPNNSPSKSIVEMLERTKKAYNIYFVP